MEESIDLQNSCGEKSFIKNILPHLGEPFMGSCEVAIIGGGRWGKIITTVLTKCAQNVSKIHLISNRNFKNTSSWVKEMSSSDNIFSDKVVVGNALDEVVGNNAVKSVFVVNCPEEHYHTAKVLLEANKHVMVEKPFVSNVKQANELINLAKEKGLILTVGLEFMMASYVHYFRDFLEQHEVITKKVKIVWHDVFGGQRHGVFKLPDMTVNTFNDIFWHILSILFVLYKEQDIKINDVFINDGGDSSVINLNYGSFPIEVNLSRTAKTPKRKIEVFAKNKPNYSLDFTKEPGKVQFDNKELPQDSCWKNLPSPLELEIDYFLREMQSQSKSLPFLAEKTIGMVEAIEYGNKLIIKEQKSLIRDFLVGESLLRPTREIIIALREHLLLKFLEKKLIINPKNQERINFWAEKAAILIRRFSNQLFTTQRELAEELDVSKEELISLNSAVRESNFAQSLILEHGYGAKYWENTIIPLIQSGKVDAVVNGSFQYPYRVGVYLGPSCMFSCSFCGSTSKARYQQSEVLSGNQLFKSIFLEAPKDDPYRFYISGGLEPLTNKGIGEIVRFGTEQGFKLSIYTNGFLLTPELLQRQPELWELNVLRISIMGVDDESTFTVTKNKKAFNQVVRNAKNFLRLRDKCGSSVKFGFNFVILPGCADQVLKLAEIIAEINRESGAQRQVDFLTLREDYSYSEKMDSNFEGKEDLRRVFRELNARKQKADLQHLYIDYGYALYGPSIGGVGIPLYTVKHNQMRPKGYPQISVVVDLLGDVYLYREAGFLGRPGVHRYKIGRVCGSKSLQSVICEFVERGKSITSQVQDTNYFDAFDHILTGLFNQIEDDMEFGIPFAKGPVNDRIYIEGGDKKLIVGHPSLPEVENK